MEPILVTNKVVRINKILRQVFVSGLYTVNVIATVLGSGDAKMHIGMPVFRKLSHFEADIHVNR
jgi:hypothetical protein